MPYLVKRVIQNGRLQRIMPGVVLSDEFALSLANYKWLIANDYFEHDPSSENVSEDPYTVGLSLIPNDPKKAEEKLEKEKAPRKSPAKAVEPEPAYRPIATSPLKHKDESKSWAPPKPKQAAKKKASKKVASKAAS